MSYDAYKALTNGCPVGVPSSGTIGANGALSGLTAFGQTYSDIYLYFPAGAVYANSPAGFYYCQMSSTTAGTVFGNYFSTCPIPTPIPSSPIPLVGTTGVAYTQVTGVLAVDTFSYTLPGNSMGANGKVRVRGQTSNNNTAGTKSIIIAFGGVTFLSQAPTTNISTFFDREVVCRGRTDKQISQAAAALGPGSVGTAATTISVDSTAPQKLEFVNNNSVATDWMVWEEVGIEVIPN